MSNRTLNMVIAAAKETLINSKVVVDSPNTFSLQTYYLLDMQPGNCHGDYLILVNPLPPFTQLVLDPILSPVDIEAVKRQHAREEGIASYEKKILKKNHFTTPSWKLKMVTS